MLNGSIDFEFTSDGDLLYPIRPGGSRFRTPKLPMAHLISKTFVDNQHLTDLINAQNPKAAIEEIWTSQNLQASLTSFLNSSRWSIQIQENSRLDKFGCDMTLQLFIGRVLIIIVA